MIKLIAGQYLKRPLGCIALCIVALYVLIGIYAPILASSKPLVVHWDGTWYFPLFRYLFYQGFYTKTIDLFYNLLMFTLPLLVLGLCLFRKKKGNVFFIVSLLQCALFLFLLIFPVKNPEGVGFKKGDFTTMSPYARLNVLLKEKQKKAQHDRLVKAVGSNQIPSLWNQEQGRVSPETHQWIQQNLQKINFEIPALLKDFHWEEDAGGDQILNRKVKFWDLTRINHKDLVASLIFGVRISLLVGFLAVSLSLIIGIPLGAIAGYYAGKSDIVICRLMEVWEAMPTFFMLLLVVAVSQSKSIFVVVAVLGFFGWVGMARFIRGEFLKQRSLPYVEASHCLGFSNTHIIFSHILPNAIPPVLTLLPFAVMGAITSEAALSFLGLGEEGSASWGVLMDEGRSAFPGESYLLWPPAILLTILLVAIAIVGDTLRDAIDPKMRR